MLVQAGLCRTCSETTLLVFPRDGSNNVLYTIMSRIVRKPDFCLGENKGADQLRGNREADQRLCFRYSDSTIPLLLKSEISSFYLFSELVQAGLCRTWSETPKTGFLASRLIYILYYLAPHLHPVALRYAILRSFTVYIGIFYIFHDAK